MDRSLIPQIRLSDVPTSLDDLLQNFFGRFADPSSHVQLYFYENPKQGNIDTCVEHRVAIYTDNNQYLITAKFGAGSGRTYLGCMADSRKSRAGEGYTRGRDLADGPFTYETWFRILADIVSYECVQIAKSARPVPDGYPFPSEDDLGPVGVKGDPAGIPETLSAQSQEGHSDGL